MALWRRLKLAFQVALFAVPLAIAFSGKCSANATDILLVVSWLAFIWALWELPWPITAIGGIVSALVLLVAIHWLRPDAVPLWHGTLTARNPAVETLFSNSVHARKVQIGKDGQVFIFDGPEGSPLFEFTKNSTLVVELVDGKLKASTTVTDKTGDLLAELVRNEWKVAPSPKTFDRNYTDDALEVRNTEGRIILQIELLPDRIQLQGEWIGPKGLVRLVPPILCVLNKSAINVGFDNCPVIKPMFQYPSDTHFGQLVEPSATLP